eukprot:SAG11_NODE_4357_length_1934_cov_1.202725_4_plen_77_part_00
MNGSIVYFSDNGGVSWNWTSDLHRVGVDECSAAETANGSVLVIMRNCVFMQNGSAPPNIRPFTGQQALCLCDVERR